MKLEKQNTNVLVALVTAMVIATAISLPVKVEDKDFTLEDSIRHQIFQELKTNVNDLYRNGRLLVPGIDTSVAARVASANDNSTFISPANNAADREKESIKNIN
jgi:hypothetical protein